MKKTNKYKPVIVVWHDAHADQHGSWVEEHDIHQNPYIVETCGFMLEDVKHGHISIAQSSSYEGMIDSILHIPQAMVVQIRKLRAKDND